jgi:hypothetical protein
MVKIAMAVNQKFDPHPNLPPARGEGANNKTSVTKKSIIKGKKK